MMILTILLLGLAVGVLVGLLGIGGGVAYSHHNRG